MICSCLCRLTVYVIVSILLSSPLGSMITLGHGSVGDPISRVYRIFLEDPQSPDRPVSVDAIAVAGTQAFYDWSEVNRLAQNYASGDLQVYRELIPDGQLASAGRSKYFGLDLQRTDWPATPVNAGPYPVVFDAHVPHDPSYFRAFISRTGWSPDQALAWDDLEELPGAENAIRDGALYRFIVDFPPRTGHHVLFVVWQRIDPAGEVFFSLSDLDFGDGTGYGNPANGSGTYDEFPSDYLSTDIDARVELSIQNDWGAGFTGEISIQNQSATAINGWTFEFELPRNITQLWNAKLLRREGNRYTVIHDNWNQSIPGGGSATFGFQADPGNTAELGLGIVQLNGITLGDESTPPDPNPVPDPPTLPTLTASDIVIIEGDSGSHVACLTLSLSGPSTEMVHVTAQTIDSSAEAGSDYVSLSTMIHLAPGEIQSTVCVEILGDELFESDESFKVAWQDINGATMATPESTITLTNDDEAPADNDPPMASGLVTWHVDDDWGSGYTATLTINNTGQSPIENWTISFDLGVSLVNSWNANLITHSGERFTFSNASWNGNIQPGGSVSFGLQAGSSVDTTPENIAFNGVPITGDDPNDDPLPNPDPSPDPPQGNGSMTIRIINSWGSGFTAEAFVPVDESVEGWQISFDFPYSITQIWDAQLINQSGGQVTIKDAAYNASVSSGAEIRFGFNGSGGGTTSGEHLYPTNVNLSAGSNGGNDDNGDGETPPLPDDSDGGIPPAEPTEPGDGKPQLGAFNYAEAMQKSLYFYDAQRSGDLPEDFRVDWRANSAIDDGFDEGVDLSGGFYDAGDHVKFGLPGAFSFTLLGWSAFDQKNAWVETGQWDELLDILRWETDYLMRAHVRDSDGETQYFYGQVGNGGLDHGFWGPPELMAMPRPAYRISPDQPGSDLAAESAATLAVNSMVFATEDADYAARLLEHAQALYRFAENHRGYYMNAINDAWGYYPSSHYEDELVWGALWLYRATGDIGYLEKAESDFATFHATDFASEDPRAGYPWTLVWDDKKYGSVVLLAALTGKGIYKQYAEKWLDYWTTGYNGVRVNYSPGGQAFLNQWGSLRYSSNSAFLALWYASVVRDHDSRYHDFGVSQINYALGQNPEGRSYVVGFGVNAPVNPHHRGAHGSLTNNIYNPSSTQNTLFGALVGGPGDATDGASYVDDRTDFRSNEVALDYNAGFTAALAVLYEEFGGTTLSTFP